MRKTISLIMVLLLVFGAVGCFFQLKKIDEGDNSSSVSSSSEESVSESESITPQTKTLGSLEVGSKVKVSHSEMGEIEFIVVDKDHEGYPENSTTLITEKIIALCAFDAKEPDNSDSNCQSYGTNRYSVSNIDQWLNSAAAAGQWYSAQHSADQAPTNDNVSENKNAYDQDAGFLAGFDDAFVAALKGTTIKVALNTVTDGGGYESIVRKFFLPSKAEIAGYSENNIYEGSILSYFNAKANVIRVASVSEYAAAHSEISVTEGSDCNYWLRTPQSSCSYGVYCVSFSSNSSLCGFYTYCGNIGVRPLCNLSSDMLVSESPDENWYYTLFLG